MKIFLLFLLLGVLCFGGVGCGDDDSPATITTVTTNAATGVVQTNVVAAADVVADAAAEPVAEADEAFGAPVAANTVTGRWLGFCKNGGEQYALTLKLAQAGEAVTGSYAWWPDETWLMILSGSSSFPINKKSLPLNRDRRSQSILLPLAHRKGS